MWIAVRLEKKHPVLKMQKNYSRTVVQCSLAQTILPPSMDGRFTSFIRHKCFMSPQAEPGKITNHKQNNKSVRGKLQNGKYFDGE